MTRWWWHSILPPSWLCDIHSFHLVLPFLSRVFHYLSIRAKTTTGSEAVEWRQDTIHFMTMMFPKCWLLWQSTREKCANVSESRNVEDRICRLTHWMAWFWNGKYVCQLFHLGLKLSHSIVMLQNCHKNYSTTENVREDEVSLSSSFPSRVSKLLSFRGTLANFEDATIM